MTERIHARYWIETAFPLDSAAATMAGEQSTGTFLRVPGETDELRERFAARVEYIAELATVKTPSLPGSGVPKGASPDTPRRTAEVTLGGVDTDGLSSSTMQSKLVPGLYFIGEVVDVTGWLGGYNFQWAWASGQAAGEVV